MGFCILAILIVSCSVASSFQPIVPASRHDFSKWRHKRSGTFATISWSPQDLTKNNPGFAPIPDDDYVKQYQSNPNDLWSVEFFVVAYRQHEGKAQILVRASANGTSKWGLGTGVPSTRWVLSTSEPPIGYEWSDPSITFKASKFPEFPVGQDAWTYQKIEIREDSFADDFQDSELEEYAKAIRNELLDLISESNGKESWESIRLDVVRNVLEKPNSAAAIQGTLRMSGLFGYKTDDERYISLANAPEPAQLVKSMRIYTMFPQMPNPLPLPSTPADVLREEISTRSARMKEANRDPHKDKYGRIFTHISTSNVSNTIHGVYFTLDVTDLLLPNEASPPAFDLFGTRKIRREWKSLEELKVLDSGMKYIGTQDTKPTFISGFIARQLVKERVIYTDQ